MADVIPIKPQFCLQVLEDFLEQARAGKLAALAIAAVTTDGEVERLFAVESGRATHLLGAVCCVKDQILSYIRD